jgi:hypothetical protein
MKKNITLYFTLCSILLFLFTGCDIKKNKEVEPQNEFLKIYDNESFSDSYLPIDIKQTSDEGFIMLAKTRIEASPFYGIYLLKTDKDGKFVSELLLPSTLVSPTNNLMQVGEDFYLFCMDGTSLEATLVKIDQNATVTGTTGITGVSYPLSSSLEESTGNFILQSYDPDNKKSIVTMINTSGTITNSIDYDIGVGDFDVEEPIIDHLTGNGKTLPFLCGSLGNGTYFFNGFFNYTLSMVFFNFGSTAMPGVLQGYKDERCISSALFLPDVNKFALSGYAYGNNTLYPAADIAYSSGSVASSSDLVGNTIPEFNPDARIMVKKETLNGKSILLYGSDTRSGQIVLYFYEASSGNFIASKHLGYSNTFLFGNAVKTSDEGLAVAGVTYLSGRFPRLCLFKIPKENIEELLQ